MASFRHSVFSRLFTAFAVFVVVFALGGVGVSWAQGLAIDLQPAATDSAQRIHDFHNLLLYIITAIAFFVLLLLVVVVLRFNAKANPVPSKTTHNVLLEIVWTIIPVVILIIIAVPSFQLLYKNERIENPEMTLKVTGFQWYWGYEYPDHGDIAFTSYMIPSDKVDGTKGQKRLLSTDNKVVLPVGVNIQVLVTAAVNDVIHSWAMPAFGIKTDAVPGRINHTWFRINKPGVYYGQCSELCGKDHSFMPIEVWAVEKPVFEEWAAMAKEDADKAQEWLQANHNPAVKLALHEPIMSAPVGEAASSPEQPVSDQPAEQSSEQAPAEQPDGSSE